MAITRSQQAKQMLQDGGMLVKPGFGGKRQGYAVDTGDLGSEAANEAANRQASRDRRDDRPTMRDIAGPITPITNPVFGDPDPNIGSPVDTVTSRLRNLDAERRSKPFLTAASLINPVFGLPSLFKVLKQTSDVRKMLGVQSPTPVDFSGVDRGGDLPYWAQLGFSSEQEYLNALRAQAPSITEPEPKEDVGLFRRFRAEGGIMNSDVVGGEMDFESARQMYGLGKLVKKVTRTVKKIAKSPVGKVAIAAGIAGIPFGGDKFFGSGSLFGKAKTFFGPGSFNPLKRLVPGVDKDIALSPFGDLFSKIPGGGVTAAIAGTSALAGLLTPEEETQAEDLARGEGIDIEAARNAILAARQDDFRARRFRADGGRIGLKNGEGIMKMASAPTLEDSINEMKEMLARDFFGKPLDNLSDDELLQIDEMLENMSKIKKDSASIKLAEGGKPEPVAKKTMPLLDLDGKEMDLRAEGGFVPIGRMEKADDVPARLSKNEFVFTADAVRNAGDGNVDKGAEVMYNMMKNLEAGGDVSKESQGLEGARKMFQTSQRLEEVL